MNKDTYKFALTIKEKPCKRFDSNGNPERIYYTARIEGKEISRSGVWWSKWHELTQGKALNRCLVGMRIRRGWNEENACLARHKEKETDFIKRTGKPKKQPLTLDMKETVINSFLRGSYCVRY